VNPFAPYMAWIKAGAASMIVGGIWLTGFNMGRRLGVHQVETIKTQNAVERSESTARLLELTNKQRAKEQQWANDYATIAAGFEDKKAQIADETKTTLLADIRAGRVRVRFAGCTGVPASAQAAASSSLDHGEADVRSADPLDLAVARTIAIAQQADAQVAACQQAHKAVRGQQ
jgi:hypothetical protein